MSDDEQDAETVGDRIAAARSRRGWSQAELAERVGVDKGQVSRWERGATRPRAGTLRRAAEALQCDYGWLESGRGQAAPGPPGTSRSTPSKGFDEMLRGIVFEAAAAVERSRSEELSSAAAMTTVIELSGQFRSVYDLVNGMSAKPEKWPPEDLTGEVLRIRIGEAVPVFWRLLALKLADPDMQVDDDRMRVLPADPEFERRLGTWVRALAESVEAEGGDVREPGGWALGLDKLGRAEDAG
ncbi:helix-turn-helix domain-containing protein [Patulibacter defluvii]|uniref:helix-turn-helix domain-containing protein n=1 Tax=Patulibacter defluvii TaxID=3095358 RepID=UPI002A74E41B|nr:helix-turn-helix transcriptional regulator [Patulibacter sp. DM4]